MDLHYHLQFIIICDQIWYWTLIFLFGGAIELSASIGANISRHLSIWSMAGNSAFSESNEKQLWKRPYAHYRQLGTWKQLAGKRLIQPAWYRTVVSTCGWPETRPHVPRFPVTSYPRGKLAARKHRRKLAVDKGRKNNTKKGKNDVEIKRPRAVCGPLRPPSAILDWISLEFFFYYFLK